MEQKIYMTDEEYLGRGRGTNEKVILKRLIPFIMTAVIIAIGLWFFRSSLGIEGRARTIISMISFAPIAVMAVVSVVSLFVSKTAAQRTVMMIVSLVLAAVMIVYFAVMLIPVALIESDNPVTDVKYYEAKVNDPAFPESIPESAENVKFYYSPGALQGGTVISLYYVDDDMTVEEFDSIYRDKALWTGRYNEYLDVPGLLEYAFSDLETVGNFDDYKIYLIEAKGDDSGYLNHGKYLLAAFNDKTKEALYKYEAW